MMARGRLATAAALLLAFPAGAGAARAPEAAPAFTGAADAWACPALSRSAIGLERDLKIAQEIRDQLLRSRFVDSGKVDVLVLDGTAILTGDVDTAAERSSAGQNAFEGGAIRVRNRLTVRGRGRFPY
ncbi:MAG: BON domain-containing protein [Elusimicrobia bacterium]|nr:BON domain-containing protein [Elusimicrobiota bacterium]